MVCSYTLPYRYNIYCWKNGYLGYACKPHGMLQLWDISQNHLLKYFSILTNGDEV